MANSKGAGLSESTLNEIIERYSQETVQISDAYKDGGIDPLWGRFERAASNQMNDGEATLSRYAIWANTVRDNIIEALHHLDGDNTEEARILLTRAANSLSAFSEVQAYFDPFELGRKRQE